MNAMEHTDCLHPVDCCSWPAYCVELFFDFDVPIVFIKAYIYIYTVLNYSSQYSVVSSAAVARKTR